MRFGGVVILAVALVACRHTARQPVLQPIGAEPPAATAQVQPTAPPAQTAAVRPAPRPAITPGELMGRDSGTLEARLGPADFVRRDSPAELRRYRHRSCLLDFYLYPPPEQPGAGLRVDHIEARGRDGAPADAAACLRSLSTERPAVPTG